MDDITIARAVHVLAVVHWIGGVAMITMVVLPVITRLPEPGRRMALFQAIEGRFAPQARISVSLAGLSGLYMTWRLDAWGRFLEPGFWWMDAMVLVWAAFSLALFVVEPLVGRAQRRRPVERDSQHTLAVMQRFHWIMLLLSTVTVGAAVLGAHGLLY
jgi:uncharacterized membrane protein